MGIIYSVVLPATSQSAITQVMKHNYGRTKHACDLQPLLKKQPERPRAAAAEGSCSGWGGHSALPGGTGGQEQSEGLD